MQELQKEGLSVALRSRDEKLVSGTSIYVVDTLGLCFFSVPFFFFFFCCMYFLNSDYYNNLGTKNFSYHHFLIMPM